MGVTWHNLRSVLSTPDTSHDGSPAVPFIPLQPPSTNMRPFFLCASQTHSVWHSRPWRPGGIPQKLKSTCADIYSNFSLIIVLIPWTASLLVHPGASLPSALSVPSDDKWWLFSAVTVRPHVLWGTTPPIFLCSREIVSFLHTYVARIVFIYDSVIRFMWRGSFYPNCSPFYFNLFYIQLPFVFFPSLI